MHIRNIFARFAIVAFLFLGCFIGGTNTLLAQDAAEAAAEEPAAAAAPDNGIPTDPAIITKGGELFEANCVTCHNVHEVVVGPALANIYERRDLEWIYAFVKNSQAVIQSGDEYAVNLYNQYNKTLMTAFPTLSNDDILSIVSWVQAETIKGPASQAVVADPENPGVPGEGGDIPTGFLNGILIALVAVLALILVVLLLIVSVLTRFLKQTKEGLDSADEEIINQRIDIGALLKSRAFLGIATVVFIAVVAKSVIDGLYQVGVQQGYAPTQPIAFSHALHAGQYEIDCQYCHTGVRIAKSANIPSANICMNCHTHVKTESKEIQKIYKAIDWDPETQTYGNDTKPIEWVRVHNLPDLAYFNHAQHVAVGEIECETCHGEIKEMEVVQQYSSLTMGWCINCHRETAVKTAGNGYYTQLVELHEGGELKVEDIGGLECSKCHY